MGYRAGGALGAGRMNDSELARFFLSLVLLLVGALGGGRIFERLRLPRVIGEIADGIVLGPSVLGLVSPEAQKWLFQGFPAQGALLSAFYWFGLVLLMFIAGFKMKSEGAGGSRGIVVALVLGALIVPFALGYAGWAPNQLENEIARGSWFTIAPDEALLFDDDVDTKWERALARRGIDL